MAEVHAARADHGDNDQAERLQTALAQVDLGAQIPMRADKAWCDIGRFLGRCRPVEAIQPPSASSPSCSVERAGMTTSSEAFSTAWPSCERYAIDLAMLDGVSSRSLRQTRVGSNGS